MSELWAFRRIEGDPVYQHFESPLLEKEAALEEKFGDRLPMWPANLRAHGMDLDNGQDARRIFGGEFSDVTLQAGSTRLEAFLVDYLLEFGRKCPSAVPVDRRAEIVVLRCTVTREVYNGYGTMIGGGCARWENVPTGIFADRELYAELEEERRTINDTTMSILRNMLKNPQSMLNMASDAAATGPSMAKLVANHSCTSVPLRRFSHNLLRFLRNEPPIPLQ